MIALIKNVVKKKQEGYLIEIYEKNGEYMVKNRIKSMENDTFMKNR